MTKQTTLRNVGETIISSTVEYLAKFHSVSQEEIIKAIEDKNSKVVQQLIELIAAGVDKASQMHKDGEIKIN